MNNDQVSVNQAMVGTISLATVCTLFPFLCNTKSYPKYCEQINEMYEIDEIKASIFCNRNDKCREVEGFNREKECLSIDFIIEWVDDELLASWDNEYETLLRDNDYDEDDWMIDWETTDITKPAPDDIVIDPQLDPLIRDSIISKGEVKNVELIKIPEI